MPSTKLIYGVGRVPKPSEFSLGEIIVNVDDSKVYSKNKNNTVFEIGGGTTIIEGESSGLGFTTASISASGFFTSADTSNLIISGGTGVSVTTGSNNQIIITATGDSEVTNAIYADTASYVESTNIDGILFSFINDEQQGGLFFDPHNISSQDEVQVITVGLTTSDKPLFAAISSSGDISASGYISASEFIGNLTGTASLSDKIKTTDGNTTDYNYPVLHGTPETYSTVLRRYNLTFNPDSGALITPTISASNYLRLEPIENTTGVAGALMYSASNEFYLGFS